MTIAVSVERWPIRDGFRIARGQKTAAEVVVCEIARGSWVGRGECVPYGHYGETVESVVGEIESSIDDLEKGMDRQALQIELHAGAARNAIDCALWDLEAKQRGAPVWQLAGLPRPQPVATAFTIDLASPTEIARRVQAAPPHAWLKLKLDGTGDLERIGAAHAAAPNSGLVLDANEGWSVDQLRAWLPQLAELGVTLLEQPLLADSDAVLTEIEHPIPICADESFHDRASFTRIAGRYDAVNIKLDKCGGLTEAIAVAKEAKRRDLRVMVGCMVCTSLGIAPALLLAAHADYVDLDGPLLLDTDRDDGLHQDEDGSINVPDSLWGGP